MYAIDILEKKELNEHIDEKNVDEVLIHHLTRRIISTETKCKNLHDLITTENKFSTFLQTYGFVFNKIDEKNINLYYRDKLIVLDDRTDNYIGAAVQ